MTQEKLDSGQEQLERQSLPGTNQAGKGPGAGEQDEPGEESDHVRPHHDQVDAHSLPGTNQAGKGPAGP